MLNSKGFEVIYVGNVESFENRVLSLAEREQRLDKRGIWCRIADKYIPQLTIIQYNPYPADHEEVFDSDLSIKRIFRNTTYENFYRWGIDGGETGNHRIIYAVQYTITTEL